LWHSELRLADGLRVSRRSNQQPTKPHESGELALALSLSLAGHVSGTSQIPTHTISVISALVAVLIPDTQDFVISACVVHVPRASGAWGAGAACRPPTTSVKHNKANNPNATPALRLHEHNRGKKAEERKK
jgi:hypothetical protein